ncbi:MAG: tetratricopeptide repeat protein [bacterium]|nr:tetratricopeptide repeat protein [bacterium]
MNQRAVVVFLFVMLLAVCAIILGRSRGARHVALNRHGFALIEEGRHAEAARHLEEAIRRAPNYADAHHNLGIAYGKLGRLDAAASCLERAIAYRPDFPEAHSNLARVLEEQRRFDEAIASYERAEALREGYAAARRGRARVHYKMAREAARSGDEARSRELLERSVEIDPESAEAHYALGRHHMRAGRFGDAFDRFTAVTHLKPDVDMRTTLAGALSELGRERLSRGDHAAAADALDRAVSLREDDADLYHLGNALIRGGRLREGIERIARAREISAALDADAALALELAGRARERIDAGELEEARDLLDAAEAVDPGVETGGGRIALLSREAAELEEAGAHGAALERLRRLEEIEPLLPGLRERLARMCALAGEEGEAVARYEDLLSAEPENADWILAIAELQAIIGDHEEAARRFAALGDAGRVRYREALGAWARQLSEEGDADRAVELFLELVRHDPDDNRARRDLCVALGAKGRHEEAIRCMEEVIARTPHETPPPVHHLGWKEPGGNVRVIEDLRVSEGMEHLGGRHVWHVHQRDLHGRSTVVSGTLVVQGGEQRFTAGAALPPDHLPLIRIRYIGPDSVDRPVTLSLRHDGGNRRPIYLPPLGQYRELYPDVNGYTYYDYYAGRLQGPARVLAPGTVTPYLDCLHILGTLHRDAGNGEKALECARTLQEAGSNYYVLGHLAAAETCLRRAMEIDPSFYYAPFTLGEVLYHMGRHAEALEATRRAETLWPENPTPANNLGVIFAAMGLKPLAEESFLRATELDMTYYNPHYNLLMLYKAAGDRKQERFWRDKARKASKFFVKDNGLMLRDPQAR